MGEGAPTQAVSVDEADLVPIIPPAAPIATPVATPETEPVEAKTSARPRRAIWPRPALRVGWLNKRGVEPLLVLLLFVVLTVAMTWPWTLHMGEAINPIGDVVVQMTSLQWDAHALTTHPSSLFEAPSFYPYRHSLAFSENLLGEAIITLPMLTMAHNPALALNFYLLLTFVLTGFFTYLLVRDLTGSRLAGLLSGVAFAFSPFRFMQMGHLQMMSTQWIPFTLWALRRGLGVLDFGVWTSRFGPVQRKAIVRHPWATYWLMLAGLGVVAMGLSSIYYIYFLALVVVLYLLWWLVFEFRIARRVADVMWRPVWVGGIVGLFVIGLVLGPVLWPYVQTNADLGFSRSIYEVQNWSADWNFYRNVLSSNWLYGHLLAPGWVSSAGERELFPGIVASVLAVVGLVFGKGRERWYYPVLGLVALVLTFGMSHNIPLTSKEITLPYTFLYDWVPGFKALRVPVRLAVLVDFSIYVLAGYGLARILQLRQVRESVDRTPNNLGAVVLDTQRLQPIEPVTLANPIRRWPMIVAGVLTLLVLIEFVNPLDTSFRKDVASQLATIQPYNWLAQPQNAGPVLELPLSADSGDAWDAFFATANYQPLVNGFSSFVPPGTVGLKRNLDAFPDKLTVSMLQGLEIRHIVVHLWQYPAASQAAFKQKLDSTPELKMVYQAGDNYVYELTSDPWLRAIANTLIANKSTVWIGEARAGSMPALEVLAYALLRWGVPQSRIGGNINIGYRPIGTLPFGTPADYVLAPNLPGANDTPFGYEYMAEVLTNPAVRLLQGPNVVTRVYDLAQAGAPHVDLTNLHLGVSSTGVNFGGGADSDAAGGTTAVNLTFLSFTATQLTVKMGSASTTMTLPVGISRVSTSPFTAPADLTLLARNGAVTLLKVDLLKAQDAGTPGPVAVLLPNEGTPAMPVQVTTSRNGNLLNAVMKVVVPQGGGDFAATLDVYVEPYGTHPQGHFGYWSVVVPADGLAHTYTFGLNPLVKQVTVDRDGSPLQVFAWQGPPTAGDFRATLQITRDGASVASVPLYIFTLNNGLSDWQPQGSYLSIVRP